MALLYSSRELTLENKRTAIKQLLASSLFDADYYLLFIASSLLAIGAIFTDSVPVLVASMIVAPLAMPIMLLGFGLAVGSGRLIGRALVTLGMSCVAGVLLAIVFTWLFGSIRVTDTFISFSSNHGIAVMVAVVSGAIAAYGTMRPRIASVITGVAIAVSLMPPLIATGVGFASNDKHMMHDALSLFLLNVIGILVASALVFVRFDMRKAYRAEQNT